MDNKPKATAHINAVLPRRTRRFRMEACSEISGANKVIRMAPATKPPRCPQLSTFSALKPLIKEKPK